MLKIGIIGCGSIAAYRHVPEFHARKDCTISCFYDPVRERAQKLADQYGGRVSDSLEEILAEPSIDAVCISTPNKYHAPVTIAALKAGKHVLCEKPMATSIEDAKAMIDTAKASGKFLMIGHNQRLAAAHVRARQILASGELGRVLTFRTAFGHDGPEFWSQDKGKHTWFFKEQEASIGAMADLGIHKADLIRWLIDDEIVEVKAFVSTLDKTDAQNRPIEVDDNAVCILKSKRGILGTLAASWTYYGGEDNGTTLYCSKGVMKIYENPDFPIEITRNNGEKIYYKVGRIQTNENQNASGIADMFAEAIKSGRQPEISGEEGLAALRIVMACLESSKTGMTVTIEQDETADRR